MAPPLSNSPTAGPTKHPSVGDDGGDASLIIAENAVPIERPPGGDGTSLTYVGNNPEDIFPLGLCQGDCDDDADCTDDLICYQRVGYEGVPGCPGAGKMNVDYCISVKTRPVTGGLMTPPPPPGNGTMLIYEEADNDGPAPATGYGPSDWKSVNARETDEARYWGQYEEWIRPSLDWNMCDGGYHSDRQSPIDLTYEGATAICEEYHQIRSRKGSYALCDDRVVKFEILPTKLRINYHWETAGTVSGESDTVEGPSADVPKSWGNQLPVLHIDVKIPSEHTIEGRRYAAEYQVFLIQNRDSRRGAPAVSVLIDLHPEDETNRHFQKALDMFRREWEDDARGCREILSARSPESRRDSVVVDGGGQQWTCSEWRGRA